MRHKLIWVCLIICLLFMMPMAAFAHSFDVNCLDSISVLGLGGMILVAMGVVTSQKRGEKMCNKLSVCCLLIGFCCLLSAVTLAIYVTVRCNSLL